MVLFKDKRNVARAHPLPHQIGDHAGSAADNRSRNTKEILEYRSEIDGLRALAVVPVLLFHAGFSWFSGGFVGVDVFFVISGYLITSIILAEKSAGTFTLLGFYERRARRILPALFLVTVACIPFAKFWLLPADMKDFTDSLTAVALFSSNILFWLQSGYFDSAAELKPLLHTWSLAVEEQFYLLFPPFLLLSYRWGGLGAAAILGAAATASLALAHWGAYQYPEAAFFLLPTRIWELGMGAIVALYLAGQQTHRHNNIFSQVLSASGILLILTAIFAIDQSTPYPSLYAIPPTIGATLVILFASPTTLAGRLLSTKCLVGLGLISYSTYLWHQPIFAFARHKLTDEPRPALMLGLLLAAVLLGFLTWRIVELPFRSRETTSKKFIFSFSVLGSSFILAIGLSGLSPQENANSLDAEQLKLLGNRQQIEKYSWDHMNRLNLVSFNGANHKVFIAGDSFAADIVNAIHEVTHQPGVGFSTHLIQSGCGNLFLKQSFLDKIKPKEQEACAKLGWFESDKAQELLQQADEVWLISSWKPWQVELLKESIANLEAAFGRKFLVFGRKSFGNGPRKEYANMPLESRVRVLVDLKDKDVVINARIQQVLGQNVYFSLSDRICENNRCRLFDDRGRLISYDGAHLTPAGATYVGRKLQQYPRFKKVFGDGNAAQMPLLP